MSVLNKNYKVHSLSNLTHCHQISSKYLIYKSSYKLFCRPTLLLEISSVTLFTITSQHSPWRQITFWEASSNLLSELLEDCSNKFQCLPVSTRWGTDTHFKTHSIHPANKLPWFHRQGWVDSKFSRFEPTRLPCLRRNDDQIQ